MEIQYRRELPQLLKELNLPLVAVEIGCAEGFNSYDLLSNGIRKLYSVDAWETLNQKGDGGNDQEWHDKNYEATKKRLEPFGSRSEILKGLSSKMAANIPDESIGLLYLDGDHSYLGVMSDLNNWDKKVVSGGVISGHDFLAPEYGVKNAVEEYCSLRGYEIHIIPEDKDEDAGFYFIKK